MGKVRNETIKKFARSIIEKYPDKFSQDYENNKKLLEEVADIQSKKLKNKIAGYVTTLISRTPSEPITEPTQDSVIPPKEVKEPAISEIEKEVEPATEEKLEEKLKEIKPVEEAKPVEEEKEIKKEMPKEEKLEKKVEKPKEEKAKKPVKSAAEKKPEKTKPKKTS